LRVANNIDAQSLHSCGGRAAHTLTDRDSHACRQPLERTQYEFPVAQHIDTEPVDVGQGGVQQANEIGRIRKRILFISDQRGQLIIQ
jgi:hypothetical protein